MSIHSITQSEEILRIAQEASLNSTPSYYKDIDKYFNRIDFAFKNLVKFFLIQEPATNPITGRAFIPARSFESPKKPVNGKWTISSRMEDSKGIPLQTTLETIQSNLVRSNKELLNPRGQPELDYKTQVSLSLTPNAFASWKGTVITSQLFQEIEWFLKQNKEIKINAENGSVATVSLKGVTRNDVLAAILGHETTHMASHDLSTKTLACLMTLLGIILPFPVALSFSRTSISPEFVYLATAIPIATLGILISNAHSRFCEFRADSTGAFLASEAGYDPRGALAFLALFNDIMPNPANATTSTHPTNTSRLNALLRSINAFNPQSLAGKVKWEHPGATS
jgi:hypothetical protein